MTTEGSGRQARYQPTLLVVWLPREKARINRPFFPRLILKSNGEDSDPVSVDRGINRPVGISAGLVRCPGRQMQRLAIDACNMVCVCLVKMSAQDKVDARLE